MPWGLMTEYQWEQKKKERDAHINYLMNCAGHAEVDKNKYEVQHIVLVHEEWWKKKTELEAEGWELADYGQVATISYHEGYFRKLKST